MSDIVLSILSITYNHEKYIRQTLDSFLNQKTDFAYEILIHDDASTDGTQDIIREYMERYPDKVRAVLQTENQYSKGNSVFSYLIPMIRGQYLATCEGDDYWSDDTKLQRQMDILREHPDYIGCVHQTVEHNCRTGEEKQISYIKEDRLVTFDDVIKGGNKAYQLSSLMIKKDFILNKEEPAFMKVSKTVGDFPLALNLVLSGKLYFINRPMSVYRFQSSEGAWTVRRKDRSITITHYNEIIKVLELVDEYSDFSYHKQITEKIKYFRYSAAKENNWKKAVFLKEYRELFKRESRIDQIKLLIKAVLPSALVNYIIDKKNGK